VSAMFGGHFVYRQRVLKLSLPLLHCQVRTRVPRVCYVLPSSCLSFGGECIVRTAVLLSVSL
jgi:hypothetical protein